MNTKYNYVKQTFPKKRRNGSIAVLSKNEDAVLMTSLKHDVMIPLKFQYWDTWHFSVGRGSLGHVLLVPILLQESSHLVLQESLSFLLKLFWVYLFSLLF